MSSREIQEGLQRLYELEHAYQSTRGDAPAWVRELRKFVERGIRE